jgi:predicted GNAT family acetyltransferase
LGEETTMSDPDLNETAVENNLSAHRFEIRFPEGLALLKYHYDAAGRLSLDHTEVPPELQHHGIAGRLAEQAFDFAKHRNLKVFPRCPYVIAYLEAHPELEPVVDRHPLS